MAWFEWNLHTQISSGDSPLNTTFCDDYIVDTITWWTLPFCFMTHYDITKDVHCDIIMGLGIIMCAYHDVTIHTDVARTLIYISIAVPNYDISVFLVKSL